jgi:hypothetical protein
LELQWYFSDEFSNWFWEWLWANSNYNFLKTFEIFFDEAA